MPLFKSCFGGFFEMIGTFSTDKKTAEMYYWGTKSHTQQYLPTTEDELETNIQNDSLQKTSSNML